MTKRAPFPFSRQDDTWNDPYFASLLEEIEREETPEHLLTLARLLQEQLVLRRQRQQPN